MPTESKLRIGESVSLEEFARRFVARPEEWERLQALQGVSSPKEVCRTHNPTSPNAKYRVFPNWYAMEEPSAEFSERQELEARLIAGLRQVLAAGDYVGSGRPKSSYTRHYLERADWLSTEVDLRSWTVGRGPRLLTDVRVESSMRKGDDERLYELILNLVSELAPGSASKSDIAGLCIAQFDFPISDTMFARAWERAMHALTEVDRMGWQRAGRKPRKSKTIS